VGDVFSKDHLHSDICNNHLSACVSTKQASFFIFAFVFIKMLGSSSPMAKNSQKASLNFFDGSMKHID
jgi:hypothetical protein